VTAKATISRKQSEKSASPTDYRVLYLFAADRRPTNVVPFVLLGALIGFSQTAERHAGEAKRAGSNKILRPRQHGRYLSGTFSARLDPSLRSNPLKKLVPTRGFEPRTY
jgi:hypothetical protein